MDKIRVLIVDDHLVIREGLTVMLESTGEFIVVGQATTGQEAIILARELRPDIAIIDIQMPNMDGIDATQQIRRQAPTTQVVILSTFDQDEYIYQSIQAGARGFLPKGSSLEDLLSAIRAAARGESWLPPAIATRLANRIAELRAEPELTQREWDVLRLMVQGLRNKEIGEQLQITERTIKNHVANVMAKLGARNRTEAVARAIQEGWVSLD